MLIMFRDLLQDAKFDGDPFVFEHLTTGSLADRVKTGKISCSLQEIETGYHIVNSIGIVGEDIHRISLTSERAKKLRPKGSDSNPLLGLNRWLYRFPTEREFTEIMRISEVTDVKLTIGSDGKRLVGLNRFLGLYRKRPNEVAWKYQQYDRFDYIQLYLFEPIVIFNDSKLDIKIEKQENEDATVSRVALGWTHYFATSNKVSYGIERVFTEKPTGIGGIPTDKPNYFRRVVQFAIPYWVGIFEWLDIALSEPQVLSGLPVFATFNEEKIPLEHFYGTIDKIPLTSKINKTIYETKIKMTEAF